MLLIGVLKIVIIWLGARQVLNNTLSVGLLIAFISYKDQFIGRVSVLIDRAVDLKMLRLHAERLADIALTDPETRSSLVPALGVRPPPSIEFRNVSFRYSEHEPWVLDNVNLRIEAEESVAIIGPSGGGKSTLLKLLAGLIKPCHGEILIDGEPLNRIGLENYRAMIGVVMQDDQLFAGSIADNISFFSEQPDFERVMLCAKRAAVHDDIAAMPMGYGTLIGDMGTVLSGGQKQRVVIARALYRQPGILLLDEATSHLDVERERLVNAAFGEMRITRIVIAHRPETIRMSGRVVALDQGRIRSLDRPAQRDVLRHDGPDRDRMIVDAAPTQRNQSKRNRRGRRRRHAQQRAPRRFISEGQERVLSRAPEGPTGPGSGKELSMAEEALPRQSSDPAVQRDVERAGAPVEGEIHLPRATFDLSLYVKKDTVAGTDVVKEPAE
jgi:ATP-binding cassette subfamily B protein RaxB